MRASMDGKAGNCELIGMICEAATSGENLTFESGSIEASNGLLADAEGIKRLIQSTSDRRRGHRDGEYLSG